MVAEYLSVGFVPFPTRRQGRTGCKLCATVIFNRQVYLLIALSKSLFTFSKYLNAFSKEAFAFSNPSLLTHFSVFRK
ncbi:hypothetical protein GXM_02227 [Nostoc sphaeroides CCNUC1]|uniref:Uncharacterized protein n=1 Tax=Nostoc sphaeroides CCNUC1 TaxID=2653204 RepID=A0A5P8VWF3_9NOSO|nr:hypothetical protein GXM_02227 [Nostoc sphaeroides CCNUC1]